MNTDLRPEQNHYCGPHFKMKSKLINKFFNEPVDALDLRLDKAEATLSSSNNNPLEIKQEEVDPSQSKDVEYPLDCSEVQIATPSYNSDVNSQQLEENSLRIGKKDPMITHPMYRG